MNTYESTLSRILEERTPIDRPGYYIICQEDKTRFTLEKPHNVEVIHADKFVALLVEGCKEVIRTFEQSSDNLDLYAFCLYTSEFKEVRVYLNTLSAYETTLKQHEAKYPDSEHSSFLKYNPGDYSFQFWAEDMGPAGNILDYFRDLSDYPSLTDEVLPLEAGDQPLIAFERGIVEAGYNLLVLKAMQQLIAEDAFTPLKRTDHFIAYASINEPLLDYSVVMRKTIRRELFYSLFPEVKEKDLLFEEAVSANSKLTAAQYLDYWLDAVHDQYNRTFPYTLNRSAYDIFCQMEHLGSALAEESLRRLLQLAGQNDWASEDYYLASYYMESLFYTGPMTPEHKEICRMLAPMFGVRHVSIMDDEFKDWAEILEAFAA